MAQCALAQASPCLRWCQWNLGRRSFSLSSHKQKSHTHHCSSTAAFGLSAVAPGSCVTICRLKTSHAKSARNLLTSISASLDERMESFAGGGGIFGFGSSPCKGLVRDTSCKARLTAAATVQLLRSITLLPPAAYLPQERERRDTLASLAARIPTPKTVLANHLAFGSAADGTSPASSGGAACHEATGARKHGTPH